jgi:hypothetical protein
MSGFTLIHGDGGKANILIPRAGDRPVYIIDRQPFERLYDDCRLSAAMGVYIATEYCRAA